MNASLRGRIILVPFLVVVCCLLGCGRPRLARYSLSGKVMYRNNPVPSGRIVLEPDGSRENRGPAAYAVIIGGRFETEKAKGHVGGPHRVVIQGFTMPAAAPGEDTLPQPLFSEYTTTVDLPKKNSTQDFVVP